MEIDRIVNEAGGYDDAVRALIAAGFGYDKASRIAWARYGTPRARGPRMTASGHVPEGSRYRVD